MLQSFPAVCKTVRPIRKDKDEVKEKGHRKGRRRTDPLLGESDKFTHYQHIITGKSTQSMKQTARANPNQTESQLGRTS